MMQRTGGGVGRHVVVDRVERCFDAVFLNVRNKVFARDDMNFQRHYGDVLILSKDLRMINELH